MSLADNLVGKQFSAYVNSRDNTVDIVVDNKCQKLHLSSQTGAQVRVLTPDGDELQAQVRHAGTGGANFRLAFDEPLS